MNEQKYMISVDWFQVTAIRPKGQTLESGLMFYGTHDPEGGKRVMYELCPGHEFNAIFNSALSVQVHGFKIATIYFDPRPSQMNRRLAMVKMANAILYSARWQWYLCDLMDALSWSFNNISRIDVCCDFNYFSGNLDPREFIRRYLRSGEWSPVLPSYYRVGGNKYETIGRKEIVSEVFEGMSRNFSRHSSEYLRFGKRSSGVAVYLYNKTLELNQANTKKYIRKLWTKMGLTDTDECPVFRLELSISPSAMNVKVRRTEDERQEVAAAKSLAKRTINMWSMRSLSMDDFGTQQAIENVFWSYSGHYFHFKLVGPQKFSHNWPDVQLFDAMFSTQMKPYRASIPLDSGVAERNAATRLEKILFTCSDLSAADAVSVEGAIDVLRRMSQLKEGAYDHKSLEKIADGLTAGQSWEELQKRRIMPTALFNKMRQHVENAAERELIEMRRDPYVLEQMDYADYQRENTKELYNILTQ